MTELLIADFHGKKSIFTSSRVASMKFYLYPQFEVSSSNFLRPRRRLERLTFKKVHCNHTTYGKKELEDVQVFAQFVPVAQAEKRRLMIEY